MRALTRRIKKLEALARQQYAAGARPPHERREEAPIEQYRRLLTRPAEFTMRCDDAR